MTAFWLGVSKKEDHPGRMEYLERFAIVNVFGSDWSRQICFREVSIKI
jgi:hypothetical protein